MLKYSLFFLLCYNVLFSLCKIDSIIDEFASPEIHFVYWPNATIPFYINPEHFDSEQSLSILSSLSLFAFKTCLKFAPVMAEPTNDHVLVVENPNGQRSCDVNNAVHSFEEPHRMTLGYECLKSPKIDMMIMRALGFPFEHNRASRDVFIDVQFENIQPGTLELFTQDAKLPPELRALPYDVNSVMHFGDRDFSKNGHKTIIFKNHKTKQNRVSLTPTDIRKIEIVYGPECQKRDRQAKVDLCQHYPGINRKKRDTDAESTRSLRVNPNITPPQDHLPEEMSRSIKDLGVADEVQNIVEDVYKLTAIALKNARVKYCNDSKDTLRSDAKRNEDDPKTDILGIIQVITKYTQTVVDNAASNLTEFCETSQSIDKYVRSRCGWYNSNNNRCRLTFKSTKSGAVKYSTQHRPVYYQPTNHKGRAVVYNYDHVGYRAGPDVENGTDSRNITDRQKRSVASDKTTTDSVQVSKETKAANIDSINSQNRSAVFDASDNSTKSILRMATTIHFPKKDNYAPVWRRSKQNRFKEINKNPEDISKPIKNARTRRTHYKRKSGEKIEVVEKEIEEERQQRPGNKARKIKDRAGVSVPKTVKLSRENKEFYDERMWPDNIVRYIITEDSRYNIQDLRSRLDEVNNILTGKTCVRLEEIADPDLFNDYLVLDISPDYVTGRVGGRQIFGSVELFEGGQHRQHAAMMVMAMLGFYFEISRHDRDSYIRVHNRHIRPDKLHHFEKIRSDATLPLPYDYESATHPAWQFWRKLGKTGISAVATFKDKDPNGTIMKSLGQNENILSKYDLIKINSVYGIECFRNQRRMKITSDN